jgi:hypothetical protein
MWSGTCPAVVSSAMRFGRSSAPRTRTVSPRSRRGRRAQRLLRPGCRRARCGYGLRVYAGRPAPPLRVQLTTDGHSSYLAAVEDAFGENLMREKQYSRASVSAASRRLSPASSPIRDTFPRHTWSVRNLTMSRVKHRNVHQTLRGTRQWSWCRHPHRSIEEI